MAHDVSQTKVKLPHNYESILGEADSQVDKSSSIDKLYDQLYSGVFLNQMKKDSQSFEVKGKFNTMNLTPATLYQVSFTLMMKDEAQNGWEDPVNLKLFLPNETSEVRKEYLNKRPKNQWIEILVGTFTTTYMDSGDIEFSMYEFGKRLKKGIVILGAVIKPFSFR
ncbi:protein PHLOEM PROTEIN 2-LIKE A1-like isoform X2 [Pistacia vera]|uniref:protein PHLOEM PROTEIN 2-LIKE A1-like isoform X2 n=1 Tax=Pistacia vera TaxID=55513 RepID=UPI00126361E7|nr:protein PHLOEM PROTEIN 2-LIKE A1-like isoform X2 [Pistacia vera]